MRDYFYLFLSLVSIIIISTAFISTASVSSTYFDVPQVSDTISIGNRSYGTASNIMTDQDAVVCIPPAHSALQSIELYFSSFGQSDSLRLVVKSKPSWSCPGIGGVANPISHDSYTLAWTENVFPVVGWNTFTIDPPLLMTSDTIYVWPDLIQQIQPRLHKASTSINRDSLFYLNSIYCGNGVVVWDQMVELQFVTIDPCIPYVAVVDDMDPCIMGDTIESSAIITKGKNIIYSFDSETSLVHPFEISSDATLLIDQYDCLN